MNSVRKWALLGAQAIVLMGWTLAAGVGSSDASETITLEKRPRPHLRNRSGEAVTVAWCVRILFRNRWEYDTCRGSHEVAGAVLSSLSIVEPEGRLGLATVSTVGGRPTGFWPNDGFGHLTVSSQIRMPPTGSRTRDRRILVKNAHIIAPGESLYLFDRDVWKTIRSWWIRYQVCAPAVSRWWWFFSGPWGANWSLPWRTGRGRYECSRMEWAHNDMLGEGAYPKARARLQKVAPSYPVYCRKGKTRWQVCSSD